MKEKKWNALAILNVLMQSDDYFTTNQIIDDVITLINSREQNRYKYIGIFGL